MNVHHLELFYYVARYGGIMEAVRNMPYGIQQPAVSGQLLQLESHLGVKLFRRRPFELLPAGVELFQFVQPFFGQLTTVEQRLKTGSCRTLRVAAPVMALRDHLPGVLQAVRQRFPDLQLTLRAGQQPQVEAWLERQELDIAITLLEGNCAKGLHHLPLMELPLVLWVPKSSRFRHAEEILEAAAAENLEEPLISITGSELAPRRFREYLETRSIEWPTRVEVTDLELVSVYVRNGFGIGLGLIVPGTPTPEGLRALPLTELAPLRLGAVWQGDPDPVMRALLDTVQAHVNRVAGPSVPPTEAPPVKPRGRPNH